MANTILQNEWVKGFVDFIFPPLCLGCGEFTESDYDICKQCMKKVEVFNRPFCLSCFDIIPNGNKCKLSIEKSLTLYAFGDYALPLKEIIVHYKFKGITTPSKLFARLIYEQFRDFILEHNCDTLIPIPLYASRENYRGYNQATIFAEHLAKLFEFNVRTDIIKRVKKRKPQAKLNYKDRALNIRGVFDVMKKTENNEKIILVDDVVTSGATVLEATRVLNIAGYKVVAVLSIAHAV